MSNHTTDTLNLLATFERAVRDLGEFEAYYAGGYEEEREQVHANVAFLRAALIVAIKAQK